MMKLFINIRKEHAILIILPCLPASTYATGGVHALAYGARIGTSNFNAAKH